MPTFPSLDFMVVEQPHKNRVPTARSAITETFLILIPFLEKRVGQNIIPIGGKVVNLK